MIEEYALKASAVCCAWEALSTKVNKSLGFVDKVTFLIHLYVHYSLLNATIQPLLKRAHMVLLRLKELGVPLLCLEQTKQRQPKHPLYIRKGVVLQPYESMSTTSEGGNNNNNNNNNISDDDTTTNVCLTHLDTAF